VSLEQRGQLAHVGQAQVAGLADRLVEALVVEDSAEVEERSCDGRGRDSAYFGELVGWKGGTASNKDATRSAG
jgi:hypothetical protein